MASKKVKAIEWKCDGCGQRYLQKEGEEMPNGFYGKAVAHISSAGGDGCTEWFACEIECIESAVLTAIEEANNG